MNNMTQREKELLNWIAAGYSQQQAAEKMGISHQTVKNMLQRIREKENSESTLHLVSKLFRRGNLW